MPDRPPAIRRLLRGKTLVALILLLIAVAGSLSDLLRRVDHLVFDFAQSVFPQVVPDDLIVVAIDESSLDRVGRWPWPREVHARLLDILCASRPVAVGFDIAFSEPQSVAADTVLSEAIRRCGNVVLPLVLERTSVGGQIVESPPIARLREASAGFGRVGVRIDEDGMVRSVDLYEGIGDATWPLFAEELLRVGNIPRTGTGLMSGDKAASVDTKDGFVSNSGLVQAGRRRLQFVGPPGAFRHVSFADVLDGRIAPATIAQKTLVIGATATGLGDLFSTPVSAYAQPMAGVEIQANVWAGLRAGTLVRELPPERVVLYSMLLALVPLLWLPRLMPSAALLVSLLWLFVPIAISVLAQAFMHVWFPAMGAVLAGLFAYPLWGWQRLEAARELLDSELQELRAAVPGHSADAGNRRAMGRMGFEQRIAWVQAARQRVQFLEEQRKEALAFISHDLRAPLAAAVQRLESGTDCRPDQLLPSILRAQEMAQDFLQLARAEALHERDMRSLDLGSVLHQAVDEVYGLARGRGLRIERLLPDEPVWIRGDFQAIERCAINLLQNALTYAPPGSLIAIGLDRVAATEDSESVRVRFWVENDSTDWNKDDSARLFEKFRRGGPPDGPRAAGGSGLGLYYVRTVADKHGGWAGADGLAGRVRFWVELPLDLTSVDDPQI